IHVAGLSAPGSRPVSLPPHLFTVAWGGTWNSGEGWSRPTSPPRKSNGPSASWLRSRGGTRTPKTLGRLLPACSSISPGIGGNDRQPRGGVEHPSGTRKRTLRSRRGFNAPAAGLTGRRTIADTVADGNSQTDQHPHLLLPSHHLGRTRPRVGASPHCSRAQKTPVLPHPCSSHRPHRAHRLLLDPRPEVRIHARLDLGWG